MGPEPIDPTGTLVLSLGICTRAENVSSIPFIIILFVSPSRTIVAPSRGLSLSDLLVREWNLLVRELERPQRAMVLCKNARWDFMVSSKRRE